MRLDCFRGKMCEIKTSTLIYPNVFLTGTVEGRMGTWFGIFSHFWEVDFPTLMTVNAVFRTKLAVIF